MLRGTSLFRNPSRAIIGGIIVSLVMVLHVNYYGELHNWFSKDVILFSRLVFAFGHLLAAILYFRTMRFINESYTSYEEETDYGFSNVEKAQYRSEAGAMKLILTVRGLVGLLLHLQLYLPSESENEDKRHNAVPLLVVSLLGYISMYENAMFVHQFWYPGALKVSIYSAFLKLFPFDPPIQTHLPTSPPD